MLRELLDQKKAEECAFDYNGNHVIQKFIIEMGQVTDGQRGEEPGASEIKCLIAEIEQDIVNYCLNEYCCRIIQRMFEFAHVGLIESSASKILNNYQYLSNNEFGIFVLSSILEHGQPSHKSYILNLIQGNAPALAIQKDGSKLIENSIKMILMVQSRHSLHRDQLYQILDEIVYLPLRVQTRNQQKDLYIEYLLMNRYANYVI